MDPIDALLDRVESLPPAPKLLVKLLSALSDIETDLSRVVDMIAFDPGLTAKLLQVCNSALYGLSEPVSHVSEAVNRLGFQAVYHIVAISSSEQFLKPSTVAGLDPNKLWTHAVTVAFSAQFVANGVGLESGMLFTAGLLHDLGKMVMGEALQEQYAPLLVDANLWGSALIAVEQRSFGTDHAQVGARLLQRWNFAQQFTTGVEFHHNPSAAGDDIRIAASLELADFLAHSVEDEAADSVFVEAKTALKILGLEMEQISCFQEEVKESLQFVEAMCRPRT